MVNVSPAGMGTEDMIRWDRKLLSRLSRLYLTLAFNACRVTAGHPPLQAPSAGALTPAADCPLLEQGPGVVAVPSRCAGTASQGHHRGGLCPAAVAHGGASV